MSDDKVKPATEAEIALWRELAGKATPGPWTQTVPDGLFSSQG